MSNVRVTSTLSTAWLATHETELDGAVNEVAVDILRRAVINAPRLTGALDKSGRVERQEAGHYKVIFGNSSVPYAQVREFENRKHPSTIGYLANAGDSVARSDISKYIRGA